MLNVLMPSVRFFAYLYGKNMPTYLLAIESSCDDTSAAVIKDGVVLSNVVAGQAVHKAYGGIVPEVASRAHFQQIIPVVEVALKQAGVEKQQLSAIAFTRGPGLLGSLIVGVTFAKAMGLALNLPLIEVHHMQAHVLAHFAEDPKPSFPFLCLTVSGGHTQIVLVRTHLDMELLGQTLDDAAGEAFDKAGRMMGLPYPAGPEIDRLAQKGKARFAFPEPKIRGLNFSFSGVKTAIRYFLRDRLAENPNFIKENLHDLAASVQERIVTILMAKVKRAARETGISEIAIAGGVAANSGLQNALIKEGQKRGWNVYIPRPEYCTDNAAMIGVAAYYKYLAGVFSGQEVAPLTRWSMD